MIKLETMQQQQQQHLEALEPSSSSFSISPSPSFSSYSSETLAEIAARVIQELRRDPHSISDDDDEALFHPYQNDDEEPEHNIPQNDDDDDEFEFAFVSNTSSPVSADDIFYNGQIKPMYPIFDRTLLLNDAVSSVNNKNNEPPPRRRRLPLRKLMFEESAETASCSSSTDESVDLEGLAEGSYCVWNPNSVGIERKKSSSTGSGGSKRWKLRNLMLRSQSDGKEKQPVMFQIPAVERGGEKEKSKRKSLLPYKPELVGLFSNVNGLGRNLNPF